MDEIKNDMSNSNELVSILDRDYMRPIVVEPDDTPDIIIPIIVLIVLIVFVGFIMFLLITSGFQSTTPEDPVTGDQRSILTIACAPGQCSTDLLSGFKTCPTGNEVIMIDPTTAVCNSPFVCDNPLTPYALQSDGSTNINGVCEPNITCPCLKYSQCPEYVLSVFTANNGTPYQPLEGQRITFPQESSYVNQNGVTTSNPPIQFQNPATTFCFASIDWLPLSGCNFTTEMNYDEVVKCQGLVNGCNGFTGSPCLSGTLAAISSNPDLLTKDNIITTQFGCVRGKPCNCGELAIYDTNFGDIICRKL